MQLLFFFTTILLFAFTSSAPIFLKFFFPKVASDTLEGSIKLIPTSELKPEIGQLIPDSQDVASLPSVVKKVRTVPQSTAAAQSRRAFPALLKPSFKSSVKVAPGKIRDDLSLSLAAQAKQDLPIRVTSIRTPRM